jgi:hypothetical protein
VLVPRPLASVAAVSWCHTPWIQTKEDEDLPSNNVARLIWILLFMLIFSFFPTEILH